MGKAYTPITGGFGDATAADVVEGKTFTSDEGIKVVGEKGEEQLNHLVNPATASQILSDYRAYDSNKNVITGNFKPSCVSFEGTGRVPGTFTISTGLNTVKMLAFWYRHDRGNYGYCLYNSSKATWYGITDGGNTEGKVSVTNGDVTFYDLSGPGTGFVSYIKWMAM